MKNVCTALIGIFLIFYPQLTQANDLDAAKRECQNIGLTTGTAAFGNCVMRLYGKVKEKKVYKNYGDLFADSLKKFADGYNKSQKQYWDEMSKFANEMPLHQRRNRPRNCTSWNNGTGMVTTTCN